MNEFVAHMYRHVAENKAEAEHGRAWMEPVSTQQMIAAYEASAKTFARFDMRGDLVASACVLQSVAHRAELVLAVDKSARGQGHGSELAYQAMAWCRLNDVAWLDGRAFARNEAVLRLDKRLGFKQLCTIEDGARVLGHSYDVVLMTLDLRVGVKHG